MQRNIYEMIDLKVYHGRLLEDVDVRVEGEEEPRRTGTECRMWRMPLSFCSGWD